MKIVVQNIKLPNSNYTLFRWAEPGVYPVLLWPGGLQ